MKRVRYAVAKLSHVTRLTIFRMQLSDYDYELPDELIAQEPAAERAASRMLVVDRAAKSYRDSEFASFASCLRDDDVLVLNNTKVFPARLLGVTETGANVEIFLVTRKTEKQWEALGRPTRRMRGGKKITFSDDLAGRVIGDLPDGGVEVEFEYVGDFESIVERIGHTPLPPYVKRDDAELDRDRERYQTVYARASGAIAAPTAGLHFTEEVLDAVRARGIATAEITLHVGYGTFEPVRAEDLSQHAVRGERYEIRPDAANILNTALSDGRRIVAVGTTTTRALENAVAKHRGRVVDEAGVADLTITPGFRFHAVGAMLTNFHLPQSSLLILVSTFGGHKLIMDAYRHAVRQSYRFYSYGDCMFIE